MKSPSSILAASCIGAHLAAGHYIFQYLDIGSEVGAQYEGIRPNTNYNSPVTDLSSNDLRCNEGGADGSATTVRDIKAGQDFTFHLDVAVYHQGPISVYMSQAPGSVTEYAGDGKWAKIADLGPDFSGGSATWPMYQDYTFTIPDCIPDGEYLLRIQSLAIHNPWPAGIPQFYIECGQVSVTGGTGTDAWDPTVSIPGVFSEDDPGYTANIYDPSFDSYTIPGGSVMSC